MILLELHVHDKEIPLLVHLKADSLQAGSECTLLFLCSHVLNKGGIHHSGHKVLMQCHQTTWKHTLHHACVLVLSSEIVFR